MKPRSLLVYLFCCFLLLQQCVGVSRWTRNEGESSLGWDVSGYYLYLPATFIYHDLSRLRFWDSTLSKYRFTYTTNDQALRQEAGSYVMVYTMGMAVAYSPALALAHAVAPLTAYPPDGFSRPYQIAITFWSLLVSFIGVWGYRKFLALEFSALVADIMLLILVVGTNYLNYAAIDNAQTHTYLFTLYAFLLVQTRAFYRKPEAKRAVAIGLICGLIILIRPTDAVCVLIPLLWGLETLRPAALQARFQFFFQHRSYAMTAAIVTLLIASAQLVYWKAVSGHWFVYSYGADKTFYWTRPHVLDYAFSYRSGWATYTPMVWLMLAAFLPFFRWGSNKVMAIIFFAVNFYIVSAWDIWWYAGTGGRAMLQSYPVILLPLATVIHKFSGSRRFLIGFGALAALAAYVNIWFTHNAHHPPGLYDPLAMNKAYFWRVVGRWSVPEDVIKLKDVSEISDLPAPPHLQPIPLSGVSSSGSATGPVSVTSPFTLDAQRQTSPQFSYRLSPNRTGNWVRAYATFKPTLKEWDGWKMTQFIVQLYAQGAVVKTNMIRVHRFLSDNKQRRLYLDTALPSGNIDSVTVGFWNAQGEKPIEISSVGLFSFQKD